MKGFQAFVDLEEGKAVVEAYGRIRASHPAGLILAADARLDNRKELLDARAGELRAATSRARRGHANGQAIRARTLLAPTYAWFTEGFDTPDLREAQALLELL